MSNQAWREPSYAGQMLAREGQQQQQQQELWSAWKHGTGETQ
jgi:hypothetical protein